MTDINEPNRFSDVVKAEVLPEMGYCNKEYVIKTGEADMVIGTVIELDTGEAVVCATESSACGVCRGNYSADETGIFLVKGPSTVNGDELVLENGIVLSQVATALELLGIQVL